jgi:sugar phosphate isomerase/epimerase
MAGNRRSPPRLGVSCLHYRWEGPDEALERCVDEFGFELVEFSTTRLRDEEYPEIGLLSQKYGVSAGLHGWLDLAQMAPEAAVTALDRLREQCEEALTEYLVLHLGTHPDREAGLRRVGDVLAAAAPGYAAAGVRLCLENHYPFDYREKHELGDRPEQFLALFERVPTDALCFCLDTGHAHMTRNLTELLALLGPRLGCVHVADNHGEHDEHLAPGEGAIDWSTVLRAIAGTGFRGPYVLEFPETRGPEYYAEIAARVRAL